MVEAGLAGSHASAKTVRHGFDPSTVSAGIPLKFLQKWLRHAQLSTIAICANAAATAE
jgi:integrase/recombinase XerD